MRQLKQDWRDLFVSFRVALDIRKMFLGVAILAVTLVAFTLFLTILSWGTVDRQNQLSSPQLDTSVFVGADAERDGDGDAPSAGARQARNFGQLLVDGEGALIVNAYVLTMADLGIGLPAGPQPTDIGRDASATDDEGEKDNAAGWSFERVFLAVVIGMLWWYPAHIWWGALCRLSMIEIARDERIDLKDALRYAKRRSRSLYFAPLGLIVIGVTLYLCVALLALIGAIPAVGPVVAGVLSPLALIAAFFFVLLALGGLTGSPLIAPAIAADSNDSFDAISRSFAYVYGKPWYYGWHLLVLAFYGAICAAFVLAFTVAMLALVSVAAHWVFDGLGVWQYGLVEQFLLQPVQNTAASVPVGDSGDQMQTLSTISIGDIAHHAGAEWAIFAVCVGMFVVLTLGLALGFVVAFKSAGFCATYLSLRRSVDGTETADIIYDEPRDVFTPVSARKREKQPAPKAPAGGAKKPDESKSAAADSSKADDAKDAAVDKSKDGGSAANKDSSPEKSTDNDGKDADAAGDGDGDGDGAGTKSASKSASKAKAKSKAAAKSDDDKSDGADNGDKVDEDEADDADDADDATPAAKASAKAESKSEGSSSKASGRRRRGRAKKKASKRAGDDKASGADAKDADNDD